MYVYYSTIDRVLKTYFLLAKIIIKFSKTFDAYQVSITWHILKPKFNRHFIKNGLNFIIVFDNTYDNIYQQTQNQQAKFKSRYGK